VCCEELASCSTYSCGHGFAVKDGSAGIFCAGGVCRDEDLSSCCDPLANCSSFLCPNAYALRGDAEQVACAAQRCTKESDFGVCCEQRASCADFTCPQRYLPKPQSSQLFCMGPECRDPIDLESCCEHAGNCGSYECPAGYMLRDNSSDIFCPFEACQKEDIDTCCVRYGCCYSFSLKALGGSDMQDMSDPLMAPLLTGQGRPCCFSRSLSFSLEECEVRRANSAMETVVGFTSNERCPSSAMEASTVLIGGVPEGWGSPLWPWISFLLSALLLGMSGALLVLWWQYKDDPKHSAIWCYRRIDDPAPPPDSPERVHRREYASHSPPSGTFSGASELEPLTRPQV